MKRAAAGGGLEPNEDVASRLAGETTPVSRSAEPSNGQIDSGSVRPAGRTYTHNPYFGGPFFFGNPRPDLFNGSYAVVSEHNPSVIIPEVFTATTVPTERAGFPAGSIHQVVLTGRRDITGLYAIPHAQELRQTLVNKPSMRSKAADFKLGGFNPDVPLEIVVLIIHLATGHKPNDVYRLQSNLGLVKIWMLNSGRSPDEQDQFISECIQKINAFAIWMGPVFSGRTGYEGWGKTIIAIDETSSAYLREQIALWRQRNFSERRELCFAPFPSHAVIAEQWVNNYKRGGFCPGR